VLGYIVSRRMYAVGGGDIGMGSRPKSQAESMKTCYPCRG
jgi:hypothetical protein